MAIESFQKTTSATGGKLLRSATASYPYIFASALALCLCAPGCDKPSPSSEIDVATEVKRPNVLIIMWDTVRADRLSAYGYDLPTTPFLDEFAKEAALYENAVSPAIWTLPSHASLFTGRPVSAHGATVNHKWLDNGIPRLSEILTESGYDSYLFSSNPFVSNMTNLDRGFNKVDYSWDAPWAEKTLRHTLGKLDPRDHSSGVSVQWNAERERTDLAALARSCRNLTQSGPVIAEAFEKWLAERDSSKPFFGFLNYMEAHFPRVPSMEARKRVMRPDLMDDSFTLRQGHDLLMAYMFGLHDYSEHDLAVINGVYDASLVDLDAATNELIQVLRRRDLLDETAVFIVSDHGENLGEHGLMEHKYCTYNTVTRVPLVLRYPARVPAGRFPDPVSLADVFATVLDLAGIDGVDPGSHSIGLLETSSQRGEKRALVSEMLVPAARALLLAKEEYPGFDPRPWKRSFRAIELDGKKFIRASDGRHEVYDLRTDPQEEHNLLVVSPSSAAPMQHALDSWLMSFRHYDPEAVGSASESPVTPEELERLKALGYGGDETAPERGN